MEPKENLSGEMEALIIDSATKVFIRNGRTGTSMQDIADEAGINRTLLNYYFRSKDKLFNYVFDRVLNGLIMKAVAILDSDKDILVKIDEFIDLYITHLLENPQIPVFILNELSTNSDNLVRLVRSRIIHPIPIIKELKMAMDEGRIVKADPAQIVINLVSMIVFPFTAKSMMSGILLDDLGIDFNTLMEERKAFLKEYFVNSIIKK